MTRPLLLLLLAAVGGAFACNAILGIEDVSLDGGAPDASVDAPSDAPPDSPIDPTCEPSPREDASVLRDACGIFAAPTGFDDADGSRARPVRSAGRAIELAVAKRLQRVYLCAAPYPETLHIRGEQSVFGMGVFGGLACPGAANPWTITDARARFEPSGPSAMGLRIEDARGKVILEDIDFTAPDGDAAGKSSVAGYVSHSGSVTIRRASFTAGNGKGGDKAPAPVPPTQDDPSGISGDRGGGTHECTCYQGTVVTQGGGAGGNSYEGGQNGTPGGARGGLPINDDAGRSKSLCGADWSLDGAHDGGSGTSGANGAPGKSGSDVGYGTLSDSGWEPAAGMRGDNGEIGRGGGGGRGGECDTPRGGGGGCGGCGGAGAQGGMGGGASIALLVNTSGVRLADVALTAKTGGNGGPGAKGTDPLPGGARGLPAGPQPCACAGGKGGNGGAGGSGGGGAGGLSVGLLYAGEAPQYDPATLKAVPGQPGTGGRPGDGAAPGRNGRAESVLDTKDF